MRILFDVKRGEEKSQTAKSKVRTKVVTATACLCSHKYGGGVKAEVDDRTLATLLLVRVDDPAI